MPPLVRRYIKTSFVFLLTGLGLGGYIIVAQFVVGAYPPRPLITAHVHLLLVGEHGTVSITMTPTAPGCPIHDAMTGVGTARADAAPRVTEVDVKITFDPPWTPERIRLEPGSSR